MSKETRGLTEEEVRQRVDTLNTIDDLELLTLKAHALLDGVLSKVLAAHLDVEVGRLPSLSFPSLVDLTCCAEALLAEHRPQLHRLNQARNECAHEWLAPNLRKHMQELVVGLGAGPWPSESAQQVSVYRLALQHLLWQVIGAAQFAAMTPEQWQALEAGLQQRVRRAAKRLAGRKQ